MENILSELSTDGLKIKLTDEKLFINTQSSNETIALRSINGIGIVDLLDEYNSELTKWKQSNDKEKISNFLFIIGAIFLLTGIDGLGWIIGLVLIVIGLTQRVSSVKRPTLLSSVRIMMSGGNRDFKFDKTSSNSSDIADFVAKVESTLTAFHKNN
jgi:hypothetical protein